LNTRLLRWYCVAVSDMPVPPPTKTKSFRMSPEHSPVVKIPI